MTMQQEYDEPNYSQNYDSAVRRILAAKTKEELDKINLGIDGVYNAGQLTTAQLCRLDTEYMDALWQLETEGGYDDGNP